MSASVPLDPNLHPYRPDLAAEKLRGLVDAPRFAEATAYQVTAGVCPLRRSPEPDAEQLSQALHGATVEIYDEQDGFGWGQMVADGYVGWFDMAALSAPVLPVHRRVSALRTYAFSEPAFRSAPRFLLSLNATVSLTGREEAGFAECARCGWVFGGHLVPLDMFETDPVAVALRFLDAPYQWGGVESLGLDCSGLIQTAHAACGIALPRDSYMMRTVGTPVGGPDALDQLRRGDLVLWDGHVGMMVDAGTLIHANTFRMQTALEPLSEAVPRIAARFGPVLTLRRLMPA